MQTKSISVPEIDMVSTGKGGAGKTIYAINLALTLAKKGYKVCLLSLDTALSGLDKTLFKKTLVSPLSFIDAQVFGGKHSLAEVIIPARENLDLILCPVGFLSKYISGIPNEKITAFYQELAAKGYDFIIGDMGAGNLDYIVRFSVHADNILVPLEKDDACIEKAVAIVECIHKLNPAVSFKLLYNRLSRDKAKSAQAGNYIEKEFRSSITADPSLDIQYAYARLFENPELQKNKNIVETKTDPLNAKSFDLLADKLISRRNTFWGKLEKSFNNIIYQKSSLEKDTSRLIEEMNFLQRIDKNVLNTLRSKKNVQEVLQKTLLFAKAAGGVQATTTVGQIASWLAKNEKGKVLIIDNDRLRGYRQSDAALRFGQKDIKINPIDIGENICDLTNPEIINYYREKYIRPLNAQIDLLVYNFEQPELDLNVFYEKVLNKFSGLYSPYKRILIDNGPGIRDVHLYWHLLLPACAFFTTLQDQDAIQRSFQYQHAVVQLFKSILPGKKPLFNMILTNINNDKAETEKLLERVTNYFQKVLNNSIDFKKIGVVSNKPPEQTLPENYNNLEMLRIIGPLIGGGKPK